MDGFARCLYSNLPPPVDFVFRFRYRLRCLFETSQKNSAMGRHFFLQDKNDRKLHEDTCIFICKKLNNIMGLFRANSSVTNFCMLFATLSAFAPVASKKILSGSAIVAFHFSFTRSRL